MEELLASLSQKTLTLSRGQEVEGKVVQISDKEVIVDLDTKAEGVLPMANLQNPHEIKLGDKLTAQVVEPENESGQVLLSQQRSVKKQPSVNMAWTTQVRQYPKDTVLKGTVTKITQFGIFVKLEEGIEGLIHVSKLGPDDDFRVGQEISVMIDSVDENKKRIALAHVLTSTKGLIYK
ncbi:S1 RNA-binding domain-containing protein [Candidatus Daviesbacteria bacterium]|nr:S1 RNA-binding domain-containing protein [Candidatus Daviesbacteria bacterium]